MAQMARIILAPREGAKSEPPELAWTEIPPVAVNLRAGLPVDCF
jgi:hypothetical protein